MNLKTKTGEWNNRRLEPYDAANEPQNISRVLDGEYRGSTVKRAQIPLLTWQQYLAFPREGYDHNSVFDV